MYSFNGGRDAATAVVGLVCVVLSVHVLLSSPAAAQELLVHVLLSSAAAVGLVCVVLSVHVLLSSPAAAAANDGIFLHLMNACMLFLTDCASTVESLLLSSPAAAAVGHWGLKSAAAAPTAARKLPLHVLLSSAAATSPVGDLVEAVMEDPVEAHNAVAAATVVVRPPGAMGQHRPSAAAAAQDVDAVAVEPVLAGSAGDPRGHDQQE